MTLLFFPRVVWKTWNRLREGGKREWARLYLRAALWPLTVWAMKLMVKETEKGKVLAAGGGENVSVVVAASWY